MMSALGTGENLGGSNLLGMYYIPDRRQNIYNSFYFITTLQKKKNTTNIPQARKSLKKVRLLYIHTHRSYVYVSLKGQRKENRSHCPMTSEPGTNGFLVLSSFNKAKMSKWLAYYF